MPLNPSVPKSASGDGISIENESGQSIAIDDNGSSLTIDATSLPLPTGASTAALQSDANASLASIDTKLDSPVTVDGTVTANAGTGTFTVGDGGGSLTVDGPLTDAQLRATPVPISGSVTANPSTVTSATLSNVDSSVTNVTLLASNANRKMAIIVNDGTKFLMVKFGAVASATSFTVKLGANDYYELPNPIYTGQIDGIWDSANGSARITELE